MDNINHFIEEASTLDLVKAYAEAEHEDEKEIILSQIDYRYHNHDCGGEQGCEVCGAFFSLIR